MPPSWRWREREERMATLIFWHHWLYVSVYRLNPPFSEYIAHLMVVCGLDWVTPMTLNTKRKRISIFLFLSLKGRPFVCTCFFVVPPENVHLCLQLLGGGGHSVNTFSSEKTQNHKYTSVSKKSFTQKSISTNLCYLKLNWGRPARNDDGIYLCSDLQGCIWNLPFYASFQLSLYCPFISTHLYSLHRWCRVAANKQGTRLNTHWKERLMSRFRHNEVDSVNCISWSRDETEWLVVTVQ